MADSRFRRVYSNMSVEHSYNNGDLTIDITFFIKPFDIREYANEFNQPDSATTDRLKWLYCTIYNYIPIAIMYNTEPGLYASIESGSWENVYDADEFWEQTEMRVNENEWDYGSLAIANNRRNLCITNLHELAKTYISPNEDWYKTPIGRTFAFSNALNGNIEFSHLSPNTSNGFTILANGVINNPIVFNSYNIWNQKNQNVSICKVIVSTTISDVPNTENRTYAVVSADPSTGKILTKYIYIKTEDQETIDKFQYIEGSLSMAGVSNELTASVTQMNDKRLKLNIAINKNRWRTIAPQIRFKVKHIKT